MDKSIIDAFNMKVIPGAFSWSDDECLSNFSECVVTSCKDALKNTGTIPSLLFVLLKHKELGLYRILFMTMPFEDDIDKILYTKAAKAFIKIINERKEISVHSTIFATEAYSSKIDIKGDEKPDEIEKLIMEGHFTSPSEDPNALEVLMFSRETIDSIHSTMYEVIKSDDGSAVISPKPLTETDNGKGLFTNFLKRK